MKKLIMIMGIQRSGGSTLVRSFAADPALRVFKHASTDAVYRNNRQHLRPAAELAEVFRSIPQTILLEPKSETKFRTVTDVLTEFCKDYDVRILWNYRDPVNVFYSRSTRYAHIADKQNEDLFIKIWNERNQKILDALEFFRERIVIVRLEDIIQDPFVYWKLCDELSLRGRYDFQRDRIDGRLRVPAAIQNKIDRETACVWSKLQDNRKFKSSSPVLVRGCYRWVLKRVNHLHRVVQKRRKGSPV